MELNIYLLKLRHEANLTIKEAAEKSGLTMGAINMWEIGSNGPGYFKLQKYLKIYGKEIKIV